jgi:hypothetical protein
MPYSRGQTQVLYQFLPGAIFEHDQYGFCRVTNVEFRETRVNQGALFDAMADLLWQWPDETFRPGFADPRHESNRRNYVVGTPASVRFRPYPTLLECRHCGRVFRLSDLIRRARVQPRHCPTCQGTLGQLRYVQAHNCGRIAELYYPACRQHGTAFMTFLDTGRVRSARWLCGACAGAEVAELRMTPCTCVYARMVAGQPGLQYERGMKTLVLTDSALFLPHVIPFINFNEEQEQRFYNDPEVVPLILARTWGILSEPLPHVLRQRQQRQERGADDAQADTVTASLARELERVDPQNPIVLEWRRRQQQLATPPGEAAIAQVRVLLGPAAPRTYEHPPRQLVEHIAVLDTLSTTDIASVAGCLRERSDEAGAGRVEVAARFAHDALGIANLRVIDDFPIALCAVGYTRITRDPMRSILSPFETSDPDGRTPLYVVAAETEGIYLRLEPQRVAAWLVDNAWLQGPAPQAADEAWAWLYRHVPGATQHRWQPNYQEAPAVAIRTLLHTISHVLLRHVEWSGFSQNSVGEYLLPGALACVLYANRYAETKIGGLTTLFEQRLGIWLADSAQSGRWCVYDPFCTDEGGTCVGCLHREYNCPEFNRELSRAVLYGGPAPATEAGAGLGVDVIRRGYWEDAQSLAMMTEV